MFASKSVIRVDIAPDSGFCFGVTRAISLAERELNSADILYCLGDLVHNSMECNRLRDRGLVSVSVSDFDCLCGCKVLFRAHGEPPSTYFLCKERGISIIDATCPVVLCLQRRIASCFEVLSKQGGRGLRGQIVIYGKRGHSEVIGLVGQTAGEAIVVEGVGDLSVLDFSRDIYLYSQTTMSSAGFMEVCDYIRGHIISPATFKSFATICKEVERRRECLRVFASSYDLILFVSDRGSSNGASLFSECLSANVRSHLIESENDICVDWLLDVTSVGICGATSTPMWLMESCRTVVEALIGRESG